MKPKPKTEKFWLSYIETPIQLKQFEDAKQELEQAKENGVDGKRLSSFEAQLLPKASKPTTNGASPPQELLDSLLEHYQSGRLSDAEKLAVSITQEFPEHAFGWKVLGAVFKQLGRINESFSATQKAVQLEPQDAKAHYNLGNTLAVLGRSDEAIASFQQAIAIKPDFAEAHSNLGNTLKDLSRLDEAEASYKQSIFLKPDFAGGHNNLGTTLREQGKLEEALASFKQAIALKPDFVEAHSNLGNVFKDQKRLEEAEVSYRQAIALKPEYAEAHSNLGGTLQELGKLKEAEASFKQAIALKPDFSEAYSNLGSTLSKLGKLEEAEKSLTKALELKPDFTEAQHKLVELLTVHTSKNESPQPIVNADQEIKEVHLSVESSRLISNDEIIEIFHKASNIIEKYGLDLKTESSQTFRRNSVDLNCTRHMQIFRNFNIIPKFCFGCYKVQVEPRSLLDLMKLFVVFDRVELPEDNIRKCMVEVRPEISGFYRACLLL